MRPGIARPGGVGGAVDIVGRPDVGLVDDIADGIVAVALGFPFAVVVGVVDGGPGEPVEVVEAELLVDVLEEVLAGRQVAEAVEQVAQILHRGAVAHTGLDALDQAGLAIVGPGRGDTVAQGRLGQLAGGVEGLRPPIHRCRCVHVSTAAGLWARAAA